MIDSYQAFAVLNKKTHLWTRVVYPPKDNPTENDTHKLYPISEKKASDIRAILMRWETSYEPHKIQRKIFEIVFSTNRLRRNTQSKQYKADSKSAEDYVLAGNSASRAAAKFNLNPSTIRGRVRKLRIASQRDTNIL